MRSFFSKFSFSEKEDRRDITNEDSMGVSVLEHFSHIVTKKLKRKLTFDMDEEYKTITNEKTNNISDEIEGSKKVKSEEEMKFKPETKITCSIVREDYKEENDKKFIKAEEEMINICRGNRFKKEEYPNSPIISNNELKKHLNGQLKMLKDDLSLLKENVIKIQVKICYIEDKIDEIENKKITNLKEDVKELSKHMKQLEKRMITRAVAKGGPKSLREKAESDLTECNEIALKNVKNILNDKKCEKFIEFSSEIE